MPWKSLLIFSILAIINMVQFSSGAVSGINYLLFNDGSSIKKIDLNKLEAAINGQQSAPAYETVFDDKHGKTITAMAFDCETQSIFYSVPRVGIYKIAINGTLPKIMTEGNYFVEGLAVDWINRNLYWTDSVIPRIMVSTVTPGTKQRELLKVKSNPAGIVVLPKQKLLIWACIDGRIEMSDLEGKNWKEIYASSVRNTMLAGLAVNLAGNRLFWTGRNVDNIKSSSMVNLPAGKIVDPVNEVDDNSFSLWSLSFGMAEWNGTVYWRSFIGDPVHNKGTTRIRAKNLKNDKLFILDEIVNPFDISMDGNDQYSTIAIGTASCPAR